MNSKIATWLTVVLVLVGAKLPAQTYNIIYNFADYSRGLNPQAGLVFSSNILYGTTSYGGNAYGTTFKVNTDGSGYSVLSISSTDVGAFNAGLILSGNILYGTTRSTIYKVNTDDTNFTMLAYLGSDLRGDLVLSGSTLYVTSYSGGSSNKGMVFKINTDGQGSATLHNFTNTPDGAGPQAGLVLGDNTLYGTTYNGGSSSNGVVFKINKDGTGYAILYNFTNNPDGANPQAGLVLNGNTLYGTTRNGGSSGFGTVFAVNTDGSGYAVLKNFTNSPDGANPQAGLLLRGNTLYGTTYNGGGWIYYNADGGGTVFEINTDGTGYAVLKRFLGYPNDGAKPAASLVLGSDGLYGTTYSGGTGNGTIFRLTLAPPQLQVTTASNMPVVFWQDDGFSRTLQTTTNLQSGKWITVSNGVPLIGLQVTNVSNQPKAFFRLQ
jgi:uncharacterized repeat protein (TIGR03803 family)